MSWLFRSCPAQRLAALRIFIGGYALVFLLVRLPYLLSYASFGEAHFRPIGVVTLLDKPLPAFAVTLLVAAAIAAAIPFVLGSYFRITGPLFAALLLWVVTYANSWGMIFHTENLLVFHVLILALAPADAAWSLKGRRPRETVPQWPIILLCLVTVIAYVLAGVAKLRFGGGGWLDGEVLRNHVAMDNMRKVVLGAAYSPLAGPVLGMKWLFAVLGPATLVLELGAPLALLRRRAAAVWVAGIMAFHYGVAALMMITFLYPMTGIAFLSFFRAERGAKALAVRAPGALGRYWRRELGHS